MKWKPCYSSTEKEFQESTTPHHTIYFVFIGGSIICFRAFTSVLIDTKQLSDNSSVNKLVLLSSNEGKIAFMRYNFLYTLVSSPACFS